MHLVLGLLAASLMAAEAPTVCRAVAPSMGGWNAPGTRLPLRAWLTFDGPEWARPEIERAWRHWRQIVAGKDDQESRAQIRVRFAPMPLPALARAYFPADTPERRGVILINADANWTSEYSLFAVALHEIGHALGLWHSTDRDAVMWGWYRPHERLARDDLVSVASLYLVRPVFLPN